MQTRPFQRLRLVSLGLAILVATTTWTAPNRVRAAVLTFDTFPDGSPAVDDGIVSLTDSYNVGGTSFTVGFDSDGDNLADTVGYLEATGGFQGENNAFLNDLLKQGGTLDNRDKADLGFETQLGSFLYRTPDLADTPANAAFVIQFDAATRPTQVSGEIWDIDGTVNLGFERWLVTAFDSSDNAIQSMESPLGVAPNAPHSLDGRPWLWTMGPGAPIDRIEIYSTGTKEKRIGLAFDNISVTRSPHLPEPASSMVFLGLGAVGLLGHRPRRERGM